MKENIIQGKRNGGKAPIGYTSVDQHLIPNKDAEKVRKIFEMYAEGKPYKEMEAYSGWPHSNIRNMLQNEVYLGHLISGANRCENAHEPLVVRTLGTLVEEGCRTPTGTHRTVRSMSICWRGCWSVGSAANP